MRSKTQRITELEVVLGSIHNDKADTFFHYWKIIKQDRGLKLADPEREFEFDKQTKRKHRFDFAWPDKKLAVEVNGQAWNVKGGGRHGKDSDLEKLNIAILLGWRVLQFSPAMLDKNPDYCIDFVARCLNLKAGTS